MSLPSQSWRRLYPEVVIYTAPDAFIPSHKSGSMVMHKSLARVVSECHRVSVGTEGADYLQLQECHRVITWGLL